MTRSDPDRQRELRELAETVASSAHDELEASTIAAVSSFVDEVDAHFAREEVGDGAEKLLTFWDAYVRRELERAGETADTIAGDDIGRFEQAFDHDIIGVDLHQALETLAIVADMPDGETDENRLRQWAGRVQSLTERFASHLEGHGE